MVIIIIIIIIKDQGLGKGSDFSLSRDIWCEYIASLCSRPTVRDEESS